MPANSNYTLIRLMRGNTETSEGWIPEVGEPLLDMESGTLRYGDQKTLGGIPINTVTSIDLKTPVDLNTCTTWGRFFIDGDISSGPNVVGTYGRFILVVESHDIGGSEIWQTLKVFDGVYSGTVFHRITANKGISWSKWRNSSSSELNFSRGSVIGASSDNNLNHYDIESQMFVEDIINGPSGSDGCNGFLITYRQDNKSPHVFQKLILVGCPNFAGREFYRYSATGNVDWNTPGFNWREYTDFVHKDLLNATGILPTANGGTGRSNGSIAQADHANEADHAAEASHSDTSSKTYYS